MAPRTISFTNNPDINFPLMFELLKKKKTFLELEQTDQTQLATMIATLKSGTNNLSLDDTFSDGLYPGATILALLAHTNMGLQFIKGVAKLPDGQEDKAENFEALITAESLNTLVPKPTSKDKNTYYDLRTGDSALLGFCRNPLGREMLARSPHLRSLISADALNALSEGGGSPLMSLTSGSIDGYRILSQDSQLIEKISSTGLNQTHLGGFGISALSQLLSIPQGLQLLTANPSLLAKISAEGLNGCLNTLFSSVKHLAFLRQHPAFIKMISSDKVTEIFWSNNSSPLRSLVAFPQGVDLLYDYPSLLGQGLTAFVKEKDGESPYSILQKTEKGQEVLSRVLLNRHIADPAFPESKSEFDKSIYPILLQERCFREDDWGYVAAKIYVLIKAERDRLFKSEPVDIDRAVFLDRAQKATVALLQNTNNDAAVKHTFSVALYELLSTADPEHTKSFCRFSSALSRKLMSDSLLNHYNPALLREDEYQVFTGGNDIQPSALLNMAMCFTDPAWGKLAVSLYAFLRAKFEGNYDAYKIKQLGYLLTASNSVPQNGITMNYFIQSLISCLKQYPDSEDLMTAVREHPVTSDLLCRFHLGRQAHNLLPVDPKAAAVAPEFRELLLQQRCFLHTDWAKAAVNLYKEVLEEHTLLAYRPDAEASRRLAEIIKAAALVLKDNSEENLTALVKCCDNSSLSMKLIGAVMVLAGLAAAALGIAATYASMGLSTKLGCGAGAALVGCGATLFYNGMSDPTPESVQSLQTLAVQ